jgi:hypothetical protein
MFPLRTPAALTAVAALASLVACSGPSGQPSSPAEEPFTLEDDFSDPASGWPRRSNAGWHQDYEDGAYRVALDQDQWTYALATSTAGLDVGDVVVEAEVRFVSNFADAGAGLICRHLDSDNYYSFEIEDGAVSITRFVDDEQTVLVDSAPSDAMDPGLSRLRAECVGDTLTFYVNGQQVASVQDDSLVHGDVGLIAGGAGEGQTDVRFDNFSARSP